MPQNHSHAVQRFLRFQELLIRNHSPPVSLTVVERIRCGGCLRDRVAWARVRMKVGAALPIAIAGRLPSGIRREERATPVTNVRGDPWPIRGRFEGRLSTSLCKSMN